MELNFVALTLLIFLARVVDVSLGTVRAISAAKGFRYLAPILGFFEVLIWIVVISKLITNVNSPILYVAYAGGFATGTYIGMIIENKLSLGKVMVRIATQRNSKGIRQALNDANYSTTFMRGEGKQGRVHIILSIINRKELKKFIDIVKKISPKSFYTIEDIKFSTDYTEKKKFVNLFGFGRK